MPEIFWHRPFWKIGLFFMIAFGRRPMFNGNPISSGSAPAKSAAVGSIRPRDGTVFGAGNRGAEHEAQNEQDCR
jgi:hypothetical protein